uniref:G-protein coupled receptors family 1 profile domain-containing protein n=1 Tax=Chaetoceros debilis TaxID=122233 RepID=A0A7S3V9H5_9STRA
MMMNNIRSFHSLSVMLAFYVSTGAASTGPTSAPTTSPTDIVTQIDPLVVAGWEIEIDSELPTTSPTYQLVVAGREEETIQLPQLGEELVVAGEEEIAMSYYIIGEEEIGSELPPDALSIDALVELYTSTDNSIMTHFANANIIKFAVASISLVCSLAIIWMIRRSYVGLSTTQNRILVGLSMADICNALGHLFSNVSTPSGMSYMVFGAHGNDTSCIANGFFTTFGFIAALFYSCSLNLYFLAVVKYAKSDEYIRKRLEPLFHAFPLAIALVVSIVLLANGKYNSDGYGNCTGLVNDPPHCKGYADGEIREGFDVPCGRGRTGGKFFSNYYAFTIMALSTLAIVIIVGSLTLIYSTVSKIEKKAKMYGSSALKSRLALRSATDNSGEDPKPGVWSKIKNSLTRKKPKQGSHPKRNKSRTVMNKAISYSSSWFLTNIFLFVNLVTFYIAKKNVPIPTFYMNNIFTPLQGLYNLAIYLLPKAVALKNKSKKNKLSWRQALVQAFLSKGPKQRNTRGRNVVSSQKRLRQDEGKKGKLNIFRKKEEKKEIQAVPTSSAQSRSTSRYATTNPTSTTPLTLLSSSRFASDVSGSNFTSSGLNVSSTHHISSSFEPTVHEDVKEVDTEKASPLDNSSSRFAPDASGPNFTSSGLNVSSMHHISSRFEPTVHEDVKEVDTEKASPLDNSSSRFAPGFSI